MDREGEEQGAVENDCQGGQGSPRAVAPRGRKEGRNIAIYMYIMTTYFDQRSTIIRPVYTVFKKEGMRCNAKYIILLLSGGGVLRIIVFLQ